MSLLNMVVVTRKKEKGERMKGRLTVLVFNWVVDIVNRKLALSQRKSTPEIVPLGLTTSKYLDPLVQLYFRVVLKYVDPFWNMWTPIGSNYFELPVQILQSSNEVSGPSPLVQGPAGSLKCYYGAWILAWNYNDTTIWHYNMLLVLNSMLLHWAMLGASRTGEAVCGEMGRKKKKEMYGQRFWELGWDWWLHPKMQLKGPM